MLCYVIMDDFKLFSLRIPTKLANSIDELWTTLNQNKKAQIWSRNKFVTNILREYMEKEKFGIVSEEKKREAKQ